MHGSTPKQLPARIDIWGVFHSIEFSRMWMYFEDSRLFTRYSLKSQHGQTLQMAQHEGELQHTKQPLAVFPTAKFFSISTDDELRRDIMALPSLRISLQDVESTFSLLHADEDEDLIDMNSILTRHSKNWSMISPMMSKRKRDAWKLKTRVPYLSPTSQWDML